MTALIAGSVLASALAVLAWRSAHRRRARLPLPVPAGVPAALAATDPADGAYANLAGMRRDWMLPLVEMAFGQPADPAADAGSDPIAAATRALERFGSGPQRLPRRPQLLPQLLGTLRDDAASRREIAALIGRDPALAGNLLTLANSAMYRVQPAPVESIDRAVALVGTQGLRRLVAVALMQPLMRVDGGALGRLPELVWEHTQYAALAAEDYARWADGEEDAFAAQLLVLLQGLGVIVAMQALSDACAGRGLPPPADVAGFLQGGALRLARLMARDWGLSEHALRALDDQPLADPAAMGALGRALMVAGPLGLASMRVVRDADPQQPGGVPGMAGT